MTTKNNKDTVLDEMMDVWYNLESTKKEYLFHGININNLYHEETKRFLSYIRFDKQCIMIKKQRDQKIQKLNNIIVMYNKYQI